MADTRHVIVQTAREWLIKVWVAEEHDGSDKRVERFRDSRGSSMDDLGSLTVRLLELSSKARWDCYLYPAITIIEPLHFFAAIATSTAIDAAPVVLPPNK